MKNILSKQRLFVQLWFGIFAVIIWAGLYFWNVKFTFGKDATNVPNYSTKTILQNLSGLQNITWQLRITPFGSADKYMNLVGQTKHVLKLQTYDFTEKRIKALFKQLLNKGVDIQLIMEDKKYQQFQNTFKQIQTLFSWYSNFAIKSDKQMGTQYTHSKINIMDSWFIIQTANLTHSSLFANREHFFWSQHSGVLASLTTIFDKDWKGEKIQLKDIHPNLVICNINCRTVIEKLLSDAKKSIIIQTQYIADQNIMNILQSKSALERRLIVSDTDSSDEALKLFPNTVLKRLKKPYNHTKMILIDHKILLLGSMNLSANSMDKNREIWIILLDPAIIKGFLSQFEKDRKLSK